MSFTVRITDKGGITVDHFRITNRSTKWGIQNTVDEFQVAAERDVAKVCLERGYDAHVKRIDVEGYGTE